MKKSSHILEQIFCGQIGRLNKGEGRQNHLWNTEEMAVLNGIVHPEVKAHIKEKIVTEKNMGTSCFVFGSGALLKITMMKSVMNSGIFIRKESVRRIRLKESRGYSDEKISAMIASQMPENVFRQKCQVVINNSNSFEMTQREI